MTMSENNGPLGPAIDVRKFIDDAKFSRYQMGLLALCFLTILVDGYDAQTVAVAAPSLKSAAGLSSSQLGTIFAAGSMAGLLAGFGAAPFLHRFGRRSLMIACVLLSGILSLAFVLADSFVHVLALRLASGFFLALLVTITNAFTAEIAPKRRLATCVVIITTGGGLGTASAGFLSGWLTSHFGWEFIFYSGGTASLITAALLFLFLPESPRALALVESNASKIRAFLHRVDRQKDLPEDSRFYLDEEKKPGLRIANLLKEGRALPSFGMWIGIFCMHFVVYILQNWLPSLVASAGGGASQAGNAIGWFKIGGIVGGLLCAAYIDQRRNPYPILAVFLALSCVGLFGISHIGLTGGAFLFIIAFTGLVLVGPQYASTALMARLFPTYVRTGGMAITGGFNKSGAMTGPFVVGLLLQVGWNEQDIFRAVTIPVLVTVAIFIALGMREWFINKRDGAD